MQPDLSLQNNVGALRLALFGFAASSSCPLIEPAEYPRPRRQVYQNAARPGGATERVLER
jgi:hypothetical protein